MKKITLVLCACAMAFAGLFVSCSNDSGDVNLIYRDSTSYNYLYNLSGTLVVTTEDATNTATDLVTTTETTSFNGVAKLTWYTNDDTVEDYKNYRFDLDNINTDNVSRVTSVNDKSLSTQADPVHVDFLTHFSRIDAVPDSETYFYFYEFAENFFYGYASEDNTAVYTEAGLKKWVDNNNYTVTVAGNIEEDDEITITVKKVVDVTANTYPGSTTAVDKTTTVYTYKLSKPVAAE